MILNMETSSEALRLCYSPYPKLAISSNKNLLSER